MSQGNVIAYKGFNLQTNVAATLALINSGLEGLASAQNTAVAKVTEDCNRAHGLLLEDAGFPMVAVTPGHFYNTLGSRWDYGRTVLPVTPVAGAISYVFIDVDYRLQVAPQVPASARWVLGQVVVNETGSGFAEVASAISLENVSFAGSGNVVSITEQTFGITQRETTLTYGAGGRCPETITENSGLVSVTTTKTFNGNGSIATITTTRTTRLPETFARASTGWTRNSNESFASGAKRYDTADGERGLYIERTRMNQLPANADNFVSSWTGYLGATATVTPGQPDPFGGNNAYRIQTTGGTGTLKYYTGVAAVPSGTNCCGGVWIRNNGPDAASVTFNLGPAIGGAAVVGSGWQRKEYFGVGNGTSSLQLLFYAGAVGQNLDIVVYRPDLNLTGVPQNQSWTPPQTSVQADRFFLPGPPLRQVMRPSEGVIITRSHLTSDVRDRDWGSQVNTFWGMNSGPSSYSPTHLRFNHYRSSGNYGFQVRMSGDRLIDGRTLSGYSAVTNHFIAPASPLFPSLGWHNYALRWRQVGQTFHYWIFIDGVFIAYGTYTGVLTEKLFGAESFFEIGDWTFNAGHKYQGLMQSMLFYDRYVDDAEIAAVGAGPLTKRPLASHLLRLA